MIYFAIFAGTSLLVWSIVWHMQEIAWRDSARWGLADDLRSARARIAALEAPVVPKDEEDEEPKPNVFAVDDLVTVYLTVDTRVVGKICGATDDELLVQVGTARIKAHPDDVEHHGAPTPGYRDNAKGWN